MLSTARKIVYGLRTQGPIYLLRAPVNELANPRLGVTRYIRHAIVGMSGLFAGRFAGATAASDAWSDQSLQFFYDLSASPVTFDFTSYLATAEVERRLRGLRSLNVIFVLGPYGGVRREQPELEAAIDVETRLARLRNILIPILSFLPSVAGYAVCGSREQAKALISPDPVKLYPTDYRVFFPRQPSKHVIFDHARAGVDIWPMLRAPGAALRHVADFLARVAKGRRPVVITLRDYGYSPERNSRHEDWIAFANTLDRTVYAPIFVPDTETVMRRSPADFGDHIVCEAASWSLHMRLALYESAWLNMGLMQGPLELCWYNERVRYLIFFDRDVDRVNRAEALAENGHRVGEDLDFAKPYQRMIWQRDELAALKEGFAMMEALLVADGTES
jgi:hypothetical protein